MFVGPVRDAVQVLHDHLRGDLPAAEIRDCRRVAGDDRPNVQPLAGGHVPADGNVPRPKLELKPVVVEGRKRNEVAENRVNFQERGTS